MSEHHDHGRTGPGVAAPARGRGETLPSLVRCGRELCGVLEQAERREWWLTNGLGSYAAGTIAGSLTRRYHGLLVATLAPPLGRFLVFAKADATLLDGDRQWPLFTNRWASGAVAPAGHVHIESFRLEGRMPVWRFAIGAAVIEQRYWMEHGADRIHLAWRQLGGPIAGALQLRVALLVNARDHHCVSTVGRIQPRLLAEGELLQVVHADWFTLQIRAHGGTIHTEPAWIEGFDLPLERERGLEDRDNHLRDTMIALPGLTLATGRYDSARLILETFARFVDGGMLPNVFPGQGETPAYNSVDAALWYLEAWRAYVEVTGDLEALGRVFPVLAQIIHGYRRGTRYGIGLDPADGLIRAGEDDVQLTWMDAKVGDWVVTPRAGKAVEINALWYNALVAMRGFARSLGIDPGPFGALAERAKTGFRRFLRPGGDGLLDVLDGPSGNDARVRPNQILAVSLPFSPLDPEEQARVVALCARELLTSFGLRSLAPSDPDYRGRYRGGVWERDGAYHQGPVWGWLLGHFALAEYRVSGDAALALSRLEPMCDHLGDAGLGALSEIFDGDPPHKPRGAPLQAWSVACTLEAWWRLRKALNGLPDAPGSRHPG